MNAGAAAAAKDMAARKAPVKLLCMGRLTVDLYGEQQHTPLTEARSFRRYPGGSSGNLAICAARLGVPTGLVTTVGDDPMGHYLLGVLEHEGVAADAVRRDPQRRTALALLGMLDAEAVNLDFYRELAADEAILDRQVPQARLEECDFLAVTGTLVAAAARDGEAFGIVDRAIAAGTRLVVDIDFRRAIWEKAPGGLEGAVAQVGRLLDAASLVVGNEDEFRIMAQTECLQDAVDKLRSAISAPLILKLGERGAIWIDETSPRLLAQIPVEPSFAVDVANPVGAGDAFLAGFLASWLNGDPPGTALRRGNACGAIVASRHGCSAASPYKQELDLFEEGGNIADIAKVHWQLGRRRSRRPVYALACDHRAPFDELIAQFERSEQDAREFKSLVAEAVERASSSIVDASPGMLLDERFGGHLMADAAARGWWLGRPVEVTGSRPLEFEPGSLETMREWSPRHVAKCLVWHHPDDGVELRQTQFRQLNLLQNICRAAGIEWMLEIVPPLDLDREDDTLLRSMNQVYDAGLAPDWWKLPGFGNDAGWQAAKALLDVRDVHCRGIVMLGLNEPHETLRKSVIRAGRSQACVGFAIGRTIFGDVARGWFANTISDEDAIDNMRERYVSLISDFESSRCRRSD